MVCFNVCFVSVPRLVLHPDLELLPSAQLHRVGCWSTYTVTPRVDQSAMFNAVSEALFAGKSVGIFPEGGSHDQPSLLPLKVGIAIMAINALVSKPDLPLCIVPVGLNYFSGHRFRSRVFVDIGLPIRVPPELVKLYQSDKQESTSQLMALVEDALKCGCMHARSACDARKNTDAKPLSSPAAKENHLRSPVAKWQRLSSSSSTKGTHARPSPTTKTYFPYLLANVYPHLLPSSGE